MKKVLKWVGRTVLVLLIVVAGLIGYVKLFLPDVGAAPQELKIAHSPERVKRGEYLANSVALCMDCHAKRDFSLYSGPPKPGTLGAGGDMFDQNMGFPGIFYARNITPYGIGRYTDGELFRVITTGVTKEGKAMFPVMPYHYYGKADPEDIHAIIAYLRTLPEIKNDVPESEPDFPFSIILNTIPHKASFTKKPKESDTLAYGAYMVNFAGCVECHTKDEKGQIIAGREFGGGREFKLPWGMLRTPNISPDATGLKNWTEDQFVRSFKQYVDSGYALAKVQPDAFNTIMPWTMYARMEENDLRAIYKFLRTVKPIENVVERFTPKSELAGVN